MKIIILNLFVVSCLFSLPTKKIFNVEGMMCGYGCATKINSVITSLGVENCEVDFDNKVIEVVFDDKDLSVDEIIGSLPKPYVATYVGESINKFYVIEGMTCMGCVKSINEALSGIKGIYTFSVDLEKKMLEIELDPNALNDKILFSAIPDKFKVYSFSTATENKLDATKAKLPINKIN